MGVVTFDDLPKNLLLSGLVIVCMIAFMVGIGDNYGEDLSTEYVDTDRITEELNATSEKANAWAEAFKSDNLFVSTGTIVLLSIWGVIKLIWDVIITFVTIYLDIFVALFGIPPIVTGVFTAVVVITLIFLAWRTIKQG